MWSSPLCLDSDHVVTPSTTATTSVDDTSKSNTENGTAVQQRLQSSRSSASSDLFEEMLVATTEPVESGGDDVGDSDRDDEDDGEVVDIHTALRGEGDCLTIATSLGRVSVLSCRAIEEGCTLQECSLVSTQVCNHLCHVVSE